MYFRIIIIIIIIIIFLNNIENDIFPLELIMII